MCLAQHGNATARQIFKALQKNAFWQALADRYKANLGAIATHGLALSNLHTEVRELVFPSRPLEDYESVRAKVDAQIRTMQMWVENVGIWKHELLDGACLETSELMETIVDANFTALASLTVSTDTFVAMNSVKAAAESLLHPCNSFQQKVMEKFSAWRGTNRSVSLQNALTQTVQSSEAAKHLQQMLQANISLVTTQELASMLIDQYWLTWSWVVKEAHDSNCSLTTVEPIAEITHVIVRADA